MKNFEGKKKRKKKDDCNCSVEDRLDDANKKNAIHIRDPLFFSDRKNIKIERSKEKNKKKNILHLPTGSFQRKFSLLRC